MRNSVLLSGISSVVAGTPVVEKMSVAGMIQLWEGFLWFICSVVRRVQLFSKANNFRSVSPHDVRVATEMFKID